MSEFPVGTKVRITQYGGDEVNSLDTDDPVGRVGDVVGHGAVYICVDLGMAYAWPCLPSELEKVES